MTAMMLPVFVHNSWIEFLLRRPALLHVLLKCGAVVCCKTRECVRINVCLVYFYFLTLFFLVKKHHPISDSRAIVSASQWKVG